MTGAIFMAVKFEKRRELLDAIMRILNCAGSLCSATQSTLLAHLERAFSEETARRLDLTIDNSSIAGRDQLADAALSARPPQAI
jgi:hypothetical protein